MNHIRTHLNIIFPIILLLICSILYCINLGEFPLLDYDEVKYVLIAKDAIHANNWLDLKLNGNDFYDTPPLLFWIINISFLIFGEISTYVARLPFAILCVIVILGCYYGIAKILTRVYAIIITLIMATSLGFIAFSHLATNDMLYTNAAILSILSSYLILLSKDSESKYLLWILMYFFAGIAILSGGLFGFLPLLVTLLSHMFTGKINNLIKPKNIITGTTVLALMLMPTIFFMVKTNGVEYVKEFIYSYNILQYATIKRFFAMTGIILAGFIPWIFSFVWILCTKYKEICNSILSYFKDDIGERLNEKWKKLNKTDKFIFLNIITIITYIPFIVLYGMKFIYLILLIIFPISCITGHYWYEYMFRKRKEKSIFWSTIIPNIILMILSIILLFNHENIDKISIYGTDSLIVPTVTILFLIPLISIFSAILKAKIYTFSANIALMVCLSLIITSSGYNFITMNSGEADLIKFARKAHENKVKLHTFIPSKKYSIAYYYDGKIDFHKDNDYEWLKTLLHNNKEDYVITEIKSLWEIEEKGIKYLLVDTAKRYCVIKHLPKAIEEEMQQEGEPEVIIQ